MFSLTNKGSRNFPDERAEELFQQHRQEICRNTDQLFAKLMLFQWIAGIVIALVLSPKTWAGESSHVHIHVWAAIFVGGAISIFPIWMTRAWPGAVITRHVVAVGQMLMSALLIGLTGGRIETHFHVFGSLVILLFYRDWRVLIPATLVVALDHFVRGIWWPYSVYGVLTASPWRSIEHAGWVIFENAFLVISCLRSVREMRSIAKRTSALEASEQGSRKIFEEAPIGMAVLDLDLRYLKVNAVLSQMVGYSNEELAQRTTSDITHPEDIDRDNEAVEALLSGASRFSLEKRLLCKNGELLWVTDTACLIRDKGGKPHHYLVMLEDISNRKRGEKALRKSRGDLEVALHTNQLIMDNSQDVICTIDEAGRFLTVNAACEDLWAYTAEELVGRPYIDFVYPEDRAKTKEASANVLASGKITAFVIRCVRKDGALVDVLWSASWSDADKLLFCIAHDVTERTRIEKALVEAKEEADRANRAKSEFLSRMSHELRTPLNAILGFGQLIERQNPTDIQRIRVTHIISAGHHLLNLINEVLDISRIETGNFQLSLEPVCVGDILDEALDLMRPLATERTIALSISSPVSRSHYVSADRQRFRQVLLNLLGNAVKYTPVGGEVTVSVSATAAGSMRLVVTDTGSGIAAEKLPRLFTPFDRLGAEQSAIEGTGLGLTLCKLLMQEMHGSIGVSSSVGHGSSFWVELPATDSPLARIAAATRHGLVRLDAKTVGVRTILYIEDNLSNLTLIEQVLAEQPELQLITAMEGQLGLDLARKHLPDLILLDLHLPDLPGWEVLAQLQRDSATAAIPVIIVSADATARQINGLMAAGTRGYLTKPLEIEQFFKLIETTMQSVARTEQSVAA
jgi:PAS domain S-box-containing protein